ncbi:hypothetical protein NAPIS_ORF01440 [Vairimorpha apis BRL 01]|uniref:Uncharacterized protein n=1 Tax=Vairimorpha apis BRL 01 TaxID=1037528 RepID=T0L0A8_9MICR|nr:hypothetical protein NAPIS_ORF01440 [Vairimorpha apis BRL 01]
MYYILILLKINCKFTLPSFYINEYIYFGSYFTILERINKNINKIMNTANIINLLETKKQKIDKNFYEETLSDSKLLLKSYSFKQEEIYKHLKMINNTKQKTSPDYCDNIKTILILVDMLAYSHQINCLIPEIRILLLYSISIYDIQNNIDQILYMFFLLIKYAESAMLIINDETLLTTRNNLEIGISSLLKLIYHSLKKGILATENFKKIDMTFSDRFKIDAENRLLKIYKTCITLLYIENLKICADTNIQNNTFEIMASYGSFWESNMHILHDYYDEMNKYIFKDLYFLGNSIIGH